MSQIDITLSATETIRFLKKHQDLAIHLSKTYHFSLDEVKALLIIYYKIQTYDHVNPKGMTRDNLQEICQNCLDMTNIEMLSRVLACLDEKARDIYISKEMFVKTLSLFLRGTIEEKMAFCFNVYDVTKDGLLGKEHCFKLLRTAIKSNTSDTDAEEVAKDLVDVIIKKMDVDKDGKISFNDYRHQVLRTPELLEFLGPCLPTRYATHKFLSTFTENTRIRSFRLKSISIM